MTRAAKQDPTTIAQQIAALDTAATDELVAQYQRLFATGPRTRSRRWLVRKLAWKLQALAFGGLSAKAQRRLDELIGQIGPLPDLSRTVTTTLPRRRRSELPPIGTTIVRTWRGEDYHVRIVDGGLELGGIVFKSASALAQHVTRQHWNGMLWLGLKPRKKAS